MSNTKSSRVIALFWSTIILIAVLITLTTSAPAQCQRGRHPQGVVTPSMTTVGCNEIDGTGTTTFFSMFTVPSERGGPVNFSFLDTPSAGVRPAFAVGNLVISTGLAVPGVQVPGTLGAACTWHVPLDLVFPQLVPLTTGCHASLLLFLPPLPGLAGFSFHAQVWAEDLTVNRRMVTAPIRVTVQP